MCIWITLLEVNRTRFIWMSLESNQVKSHLCNVNKCKYQRCYLCSLCVNWKNWVWNTFIEFGRQQWQCVAIFIYLNIVCVVYRRKVWEYKITTIAEFLEQVSLNTSHLWFSLNLWKKTLLKKFSTWLRKCSISDYHIQMATNLTV